MSILISRFLLLCWWVQKYWNSFFRLKKLRRATIYICWWYFWQIVEKNQAGFQIQLLSYKTLKEFWRPIFFFLWMLLQFINWKPLEVVYQQWSMRNSSSDILLILPFRPEYIKFLNYEFFSNDESLHNLTPQSQSSLQGTFDVWTDIKVLSTKADHGEAGL